MLITSKKEPILHKDSVQTQIQNTSGIPKINKTFSSAIEILCIKTQPGITPRREIDTLVHIARHVQGHALPDQSVTLNTLSSPFEMNGGIAPTSPSIW
jgi:hypothetical protein